MSDIGDSSGTERVGRAALAVLVLAAFLRRFGPVAQEDLEEVLLGRLAALHLQGPAGALSTAVVYFASGSSTQAERADMRHRLQGVLGRCPDRR